jgi:hypothetical protein
MSYLHNGKLHLTTPRLKYFSYGDYWATAHANAPKLPLTHLLQQEEKETSLDRRYATPCYGCYSQCENGVTANSTNRIELAVDRKELSDPDGSLVPCDAEEGCHKAACFAALLCGAAYLRQRYVLKLKRDQ